MPDRRVATADRGGWWSAAAPPHPALRPYLASYVGYWEDGTRPSRVRTLPTRSAVVIINLGPPMLLSAPRLAERAFGSFVAGMYDGPGAYSTPGGQCGVQLDLSPLGAYTLFGVPMDALTNLAADLADLLGPGIEPFVERLACAPSWRARFALLDELLLDRLQTGRAPSPEVARAWELLSRTGGRTSVRDLAAEVGWSRGHLVSRFRAQVGLPPKVAARVLRFQRALDLVRQEPRPDWSLLAAGCGFYDQPHLIREFRALSGCTPAELLAAQQVQGTSTSIETGGP